MGLTLKVGSLLIFIGLNELCRGFKQENCTDYKTQFEKVFSVPGDTAMLNSTLVSPDIFNFTVQYNIIWLNSKTGQEMSNQPGRVLVDGETLWFLNVTMEDSGEYVCILRTPSQCYMQATELVVDLPIAGECERPRKAEHPLPFGVWDTLSCPLRDYVNKLDSYNISSSLKWFRGCEPIVEGEDGYTYRGRTRISIGPVAAKHNGTHTCTLTFTLGGITGSVSETINTRVIEEEALAPQMTEPTGEMIAGKLGSNFKKRCRVFVPGNAGFTDVMWLAKDDFIFNFDPSERVFVSEVHVMEQKVPKKGVWLERLLFFSELREEDFNTNYTCRVYSSRGMPEGHFTLIPGGRK